MPEIHAQDLATLRAAALVEHYQNTMELITHHWERRSRQFVTLVAVLAGAALVAFARRLLAPALEAIFLKQFPVQGRDAELLKELTPVAGDLILVFLVVTVFYLTANLVNRTSIITTYFLYVEHLETEIRQELQIRPNQFAFAREGEFYKAAGPDTSRLIRRCYKAVLGFLLLFFFSARLYFDFPRGLPPFEPADQAVVLTWVAKSFLFVIDVLVVVPTIKLFTRFVGQPVPEMQKGQSVPALVGHA